MGDMKAYRILAGKTHGKDHSEVLGADERIILEWISVGKDGKVWTGCIWNRIGTSGGLLRTFEFHKTEFLD
jgi:hypothetical protein